MVRQVRACLQNKSIPCLKNLNVSHVVVDSCAMVPGDDSWIEGKEVLNRGCIRILAVNALEWRR